MINRQIAESWFAGDPGASVDFGQCCELFGVSADVMRGQIDVLRARGIAALFAHEPERAAATLGQVWEHTLREGVADPGAFPVAGDLVEALLWLGRTADAGAVTPAGAT